MTLLTLDSLQQDVAKKHATLHNHLVRTQRELNTILENHASQLVIVSADSRLIPTLLERVNTFGEILQDIQDRTAILIEGLLVAVIKSGAVTQEAYDDAIEVARANYHAALTAEPPVTPRGPGNNATEDPDGGAQAPVMDAQSDTDDGNAVAVE